MVGAINEYEHANGFVDVRVIRFKRPAAKHDVQVAATAAKHVESAPIGELRRLVLRAASLCRPRTNPGTAPTQPQ